MYPVYLVYVIAESVAEVIVDLAIRAKRRVLGKRRWQVSMHPGSPDPAGGLVKVSVKRTVCCDQDHCNAKASYSCRTKKQARQHALADGWATVNDQDLCPSHTTS